MRTKEDDLSQDTIDHRMEDIVKIHDKKYGYKVSMPMLENGKITTISSVIARPLFFNLFSF